MKILFMYPNKYLENGIPTGIATLASVMKQQGHDVDIFDWTFINTGDKADLPTYGHRTLDHTSYTIEDLVSNEPIQTIESAFKNKLSIYQPDIVALSVMTGHFDEAVKLLTKVKPSCIVVAGGIHPTVCPKDTLEQSKAIDLVCVGEGEHFFVELCELLEQGKDYKKIRNLAYRDKDGFVKINPLRPLIDLNELPVPAWELFDDRHLFRPFEGHIYRGSFYTMSRGCPGRCTYCLNWSLRNIFSGCGKYFRYQTPEVTGHQINNLKENCGATWFRFVDESMGVFNENYLEQLSDILKPLNINFACSVRPETLNKRKVNLLKSMGCVAAILGVESGNLNIRKNILNRNMSDDQIKKSVKLLKDAGIRVSTFNMIGLPEETKENVFETIQLNKDLDLPTVNVFILYPYPGTEISREYNTPLRDQNRNIIPVGEAPRFNLSKLTNEELKKFLTTFEFYVKLPENLWPEIEKLSYDKDKLIELLNKHS